MKCVLGKEQVRSPRPPFRVWYPGSWRYTGYHNITDESFEESSTRTTYYVLLMWCCVLDVDVLYPGSVLMCVVTWCTVHTHSLPGCVYHVPPPGRF